MKYLVKENSWSEMGKISPKIKIIREFSSKEKADKLAKELNEEQVNVDWQTKGIKVYYVNSKEKE